SLYVSAAYVDEGMTIKRFRPRARGRASRIRKRTCHITVIVSPIPAEELDRRAKRDAARDASGGGRRTRPAAEARAARVARSKAAAATEAEEPTTDEVVADEVEETTDEAVEETTDETAADEAPEASDDDGDDAAGEPAGEEEE